MKFFFIIFLLSLSFTTWSQIYYSSAHFQPNRELLQRGEVLYSVEFKKPFEISIVPHQEIIKEELLEGAPIEHVDFIISKNIFISQKNFSAFALKELTQFNSIKNLFDAISLKVRSHHRWTLINKVKAFGLPFKVQFDLMVEELNPNQIPKKLLDLTKNDLQHFTTTKSRWIRFETSNFSSLMYTNICYINISELQNGNVIIESYSISAYDKRDANRYFQYPPLSTRENTLRKNLVNQILHMAQSLQY